jgi:hypothetical protein
MLHQGNSGNTAADLWSRSIWTVENVFGRNENNESEFFALFITFYRLKTQFLVSREKVIHHFFPAEKSNTLEKLEEKRERCCCNFCWRAFFLLFGTLNRTDWISF